jgi:hypothetical protein
VNVEDGGIMNKPGLNGELQLQDNRLQGRTVTGYRLQVTWHRVKNQNNPAYLGHFKIRGLAPAQLGTGTPETCNLEPVTGMW